VLKRLFVLMLLIMMGGAGLLWYSVSRPWKSFDKEVFVEIPVGTTTAGMAALLRQSGVIEADWQFLATRALRPKAKLQAGEYRFDRPLTPLEVFSKISRGDVFYHEVRIPEGSTIFDVAAEVGKLGFIREEDFLKLAKDPSLVKDLAPRAQSLEGYLFPSTYRIARTTTARQLCRQMVEQFRKAWKTAGGENRKVHETVTLASLVEKETAVPEERRKVASVYANRLRQGIKLDCDPTVIYANILDGRYRGQTIYRSDLDNPHPFNTYRNPGLPPGPIANPGLEALKAALNPAETSYLFFVAKPDGSGGHVFSESISGHNVAVQAYRNGQQQKR